MASRGHHAEIGGITPGSMPAFSRTVQEEGVLFDNWLLVRDGELREQETRELLASGPYPSRAPDANIADLRAQIAANEKGITELRRMTDQFGLDVVRAYMGHVQDNAEESVRRIIAGLRGRLLPLRDRQRRGDPRSRSPSTARPAARSWTSPAPRRSSPATPTRPAPWSMAAVLYVFRTLVAEDIPLNSGCLKPLEVRIPEGSMLAPVLPGGDGRGQRGDLAGRHRRAVRRAGRPGARARAP